MSERDDEQGTGSNYYSEVKKIPVVSEVVSTVSQQSDDHLQKENNSKDIVADLYAYLFFIVKACVFNRHDYGVGGDADIDKDIEGFAFGYAKHYSATTICGS